MLTIGSSEFARRGRTTSNGARTGGWKEKPKIASSMTSVDENALESVGVVSEVVNVGIDMLLHCVWRRYYDSSVYEEFVPQVGLTL